MNLRNVLVSLAALLLFSAPGHSQEKVILDTDFNTMGDDGQALVMLVQAMRDHKIDLLGVTVVTGNQWLPQEVADAERAIERLNADGSIAVYAGARYPLIHSRDTIEAEQVLFGRGYAGAWRNKEPADRSDLTAPPDGFARKVHVSDKHAATYIIETIKAHPRQVTILAIGPLTNLALAIRTAPEIVPLIKRVICMGGAFEVAGNVTPAAEFNWWFDPEAAKIVLRAPMQHIVVPLDTTNSAYIDNELFDRIVAANTPITKLFQAEYAKQFSGTSHSGRAYVWDTLAVAFLLDEKIGIDSVEMNVDIDANFGLAYGRSLGFRRNPPVGTYPATVIRAIDLRAFWSLYADLMTRPVN